MKKFFLSLMLLACTSLVWANNQPPQLTYIADIQNGYSLNITVSPTAAAAVSRLAGYNAPFSYDDEGTYSFITGPMLSGDLNTSATFDNVGSFIFVVGNGTNGVPNGVILYGWFTSPVQWTLTDATWDYYSLQGYFAGKLGKQDVVGWFSQAVSYIQGYPAHLIGGNTNVFTYDDDSKSNKKK